MRRACSRPPTAASLSIEPAQDPCLNREALKISVFMNVFNVHSNRSPVDGEVKQRWYHPGKFVNADLDKASTENERNALHLRTADGQDITSVQVAGLIARRILCYVDSGDKLVRGQRYGFIRFGSRVDLYLPTDVRVKRRSSARRSAQPRRSWPSCPDPCGRRRGYNAPH